MATTEALQQLRSQLDERIQGTSIRRGRDKAEATTRKLAGVALAGVVGLQGEN